MHVCRDKNFLSTITLVTKINLKYVLLAYVYSWSIINTFVKNIALSSLNNLITVLLRLKRINIISKPVQLVNDCTFISNM